MANQCVTCALKGYSPELCSIHKRRITTGDCSEYRPEDDGVAVKSVVYAGASVLGVTAGLVAAPLFGIHAIAGAAIYKITAGCLGGSIAFYENKSGQSSSFIDNNDKEIKFNSSKFGGDNNGC
jgi:hypothetical protein